MSFGFSVGDFITAADLIAQVVSALREAGGSASQYRHLTTKLGFLDRALRDVNRLEPAEGLQTAVEAIKTTALSCQLPLLEYLNSMKKYDKSLGLGQSTGIMEDVFIKVKWQVCKKSEAAMKLETEITGYSGAINLLLGLYNLKLNTLAEQRARRRFESLNATLANLQTQTHTVITNVAQVRAQVEEGKRIIRKDIEESSKETSQAFQRLQCNCFAAVSGFLKAAGTLFEVTLQTYSKVSELYNAVLWVKTRLSRPDTGHTWLQEPMRWEDAYGRVFPIPAEFDYPMMEGALRGRFKEGRGKRLVERDQWQLFDLSDSLTVFSAENWKPIPGMRITMAMIIPQFDNKIVFPQLRCTSKLYTNVLGGGKKCSECGTWFDRLPESSPQKITEINDGEKDNEEAETSSLTAVIAGTAKDGLRPRNELSGPEANLVIDEDDLRHLKNARVSPREERPQNSPLLRRHSWSCAALPESAAAFHTSPTRPNEVDTCGYCGEDSHVLESRH